MKLKRDLTSNAAPAPNQIEVGELAINAKTGILYSKTVDGTIIKWLGSPVCETSQQTTSSVPVPQISFSDVSSFCCGGDTLRVYFSNLLVNHNYFCTLSDLGEQTSSIITPESYDLLPLNKSDRVAVFNIAINKLDQPVAILKASIYEKLVVNNNNIDMLRSEHLINILCSDCLSTNETSE